MNVSALLAAKAYGATGATPIGTAGPAIAETGLNFSNLLAQQVSQTVDATRAAEGQAAQVATGRAEMVNVVTAVAAAEVQMETMLAFRDQAISAYQEIMRMPI
jgi:flagellar hook-basal body complex protein FliE